MPLQVPERVLDLFAVPGAVRPLSAGLEPGVVAGDLVLSPGHDPDLCAWLSPLLARLAVSLEERPGRASRDLRIALPVPARDGAWTVDGWAASRDEPGVTGCVTPEVTLAAGRLLHAELALVQPQRPAVLDRRGDRWAVADRLAFGPRADALAAAESRGPEVLRVAEALLDRVDALAAVDLGPEQLVHGALAGNVLSDAVGAPLVVDLVPYWRPVSWAQALCALDLVRQGADEDLLARWTTAQELHALARAALFRLLGADEPDLALLGPVAV